VSYLLLGGVFYDNFNHTECIRDEMRQSIDSKGTGESSADMPDPTEMMVLTNHVEAGDMQGKGPHEREAFTAGATAQVPTKSTSVQAFLHYLSFCCNCSTHLLVPRPVSQLAFFITVLVTPAASTI